MDKGEIISEGIKMLEIALLHFMKINEHEHDTALSNIIHGAIVIAKNIHGKD